MLESKLQIRENLTHERLAGKESAAMLFPLHCQTGRVQQKMHKLTLIDNCTEVLLPTQAFEACSHHLTAAAILIPVSPSPLHQPTWSEGKTARANLIYQNWSGSRGIPHPTPLPIVRFRRPPRSLIQNLKKKRPRPIYLDAAAARAVEQPPESTVALQPFILPSRC